MAVKKQPNPSSTQATKKPLLRRSTRKAANGDISPVHTAEGVESFEVGEAVEAA